MELSNRIPVLQQCHSAHPIRLLWLVAASYFCWKGSVSGNVLVGKSAEKRGVSGAAALARVHLAWGIGAIGSPWIIRSVVVSPRSPSLLFDSFGAIYLLLGIALAWQFSKPFGSPSGETTVKPPMSLGLKAQLFFALALLLYTGVENSISGWLPTFVLRIYREGSESIAATAKSGSLAALSFTLFWTAHLLGRALLPAALHVWSEERLLKGTILSLLAAVILLSFLPGRFGEQGGILCIIAAACGLSLASTYPLLIADLIRQASDQRSIGWILACAPLGGAVLPWLSGIMSTYTGNIRIALFQPSIAVTVLLILAFHLKPAKVN